MSCGIYTEWGLAREKIKKVMRALSYDRILQVTFGGLIRATRFKALDRRNLENASCPKCGSKDTWAHCKKCYEIKVPVGLEDKQWLLETDREMNAICTPNPALNTKLGAHQEKKPAKEK